MTEENIPDAWRLLLNLDLSSRLSFNFATHYLVNKGLSRAQGQIIGLLFFFPGSSQEDISKFLHIAKSAVRTVLRQMLELGYIEKTLDAEDKRIHHFDLTEEGKKFIPFFGEIVQHVHEEILSTLTEYEKIVFLGLLDKVAKRAAEVLAQSRKEKKTVSEEDESGLNSTF